MLYANTKGDTVLLQPAYSPSRLPVPSGWHDVACGDYICQQTQALIDDYGRRLRRGHTVILGNLGKPLQGQVFSIGSALYIGPEKSRVDVQAQLEHLPLKNDSVNHIILPFVLDFSRDPHQLLREVHRSLTGDGYILITGFNPFSPALLSGWLPRKHAAFPWAGRYFSKLRVKDWLSLLGYEVVQQDYYVGRFLASRADINQYSVNDTGEPRTTVWSEKLCRKLPILSASYAILARKCVYSKPSDSFWRQRTKLAQRPAVAARLHSSANRSKEV